MKKETFKEYLEKRIETIDPTENQVNWDMIKDYEEILAKGIYKTYDGVKAVRTFKKGEQVHVLEENDLYDRLVKVGTKPNITAQHGEWKALKTIKPDEELILEKDF